MFTGNKLKLLVASTSLALLGCYQTNQNMMHSLPVDGGMGANPDVVTVDLNKQNRRLGSSTEISQQDIENYVQNHSTSERPTENLLTFANQDCTTNYARLAKDKQKQCHEIIEALCQHIDSQSDEIEKIPHWRPLSAPSDFLKNAKKYNPKSSSYNFVTCALSSFIAESNSAVIAERQKLQEIHKAAQVDRLSFSQDVDLKNMQKKYQVKDGDSWESFYRKIDVIPKSLLLSMATLESAHLKSRFAKVANNVFGRHAPKDCKIDVDCVKSLSSNVRLIKYASLEEGVEDQVLYLNRRPYYEKLRDYRFGDRLKGRGASGMEMSLGLANYSEKRGAYTGMLQKIMSQDTHWDKYDSSALYLYDYASEGIQTLYGQ